MQGRALAGLALAVAAGLGGAAGCADGKQETREVAAAPCEKPGAAADSAPDLLLLSVDTLRADRLASPEPGGARAPRIAALAAEGTSFEQATTPLPRTTPALASLLTGLAPHQHGSLEVGTPLVRGASLATLLCERGYQTEAITASTVAGPAQNLHQGFARFEVRGHARADEISDSALARAAAADPARPLLLWVHYLDPHLPYLPPEDFAEQPEAPGCRALMERVAQREIPVDRVFTDRDGVSSSVLSECRALYDAEVAYTDRAIGRLLDGYAALGRGRARLVLLTSDHGENLGERGLFYDHGPNVHDASLRVPLILAGPGIAAGTRDTGVARLEDVAPTLLSLLGIPAAERPPMDGMDLTRRLAGAPPPGDLVAVAESGSALIPSMSGYVVSGRAGETWCVNGARFSLCTAGNESPRLYDRERDPERRADVSAQHPEALAELRAVAARWAPEQARERTARTPRWKLVERPRPEGGYSAALYDLRADPDEEEDVSARHPAAAERLATALHAARANAVARPGTERDPRVLDQLRSLGYVE